MTDYEAIYTALHASGKDKFAGLSIMPHVERIGELVKRTGAKSLLDYGSGKGAQYSVERVHEAWGIMPTCYDIGVPEISVKPYGEFDGVICTDVLEHIDEPDLDDLIDEVFGYARLFCFLAISVREAKKFLPDGRNVHLTVRPPAWWRDKLAPIRRRHPALIVEGSFVG